MLLQAGSTVQTFSSTRLAGVAVLAGRAYDAQFVEALHATRLLIEQGISHNLRNEYASELLLRAVPSCVLAVAVQHLIVGRQIQRPHVTSPKINLDNNFQTPRQKLMLSAGAAQSSLGALRQLLKHECDYSGFRNVQGAPLRASQPLSTAGAELCCQIILGMDMAMQGSRNINICGRQPQFTRRHHSPGRLI